MTLKNQDKNIKKRTTTTPILLAFLLASQENDIKKSGKKHLKKDNDNAYFVGILIGFTPVPGTYNVSC